MIIASHQPYFLPYLPYWQLIHAADRFLIGDNFAFMKGGWIPRNRIQIRGVPVYIRVEVDHKSCKRRIDETLLAPFGREDKLKTLEMAYHKAPCFTAGYELAERIIRNPQPKLALFLEDSIRQVCAYLGITTPIGHTSDFPGNDRFKCERRVYDFCHRLGADTYVNAIGGTNLYDKAAFAREGIRLLFLRSQAAPYRQFGDKFLPDLSILDAIMFNTREQLHAMLDQYTLIDG